MLSDGLDELIRFFFKNKENNRKTYYMVITYYNRARPGSSEVPRNPLTRWNVSSIPANGIFLTQKIKNKIKNAQRVEND